MQCETAMRKFQTNELEQKHEDKFQNKASSKKYNFENSDVPRGISELEAQG